MKYQCPICGYIYDEEKEKTPFNDLPDDWACPLCSAPKYLFKPVEEEKKEEKKVEIKEEVKELKELSVGQLAALCSNLARGCEKQYKEEEAKLFTQLAEYFTQITPMENDASVENLAKLLNEDIDEYANVRAVADNNKDRGAARVCVWGEKVTRMLASLVDRYLKEGEKMLKDTSVWVCTICGFVYIGENAPEICPVCKVPSCKFEKIEGGRK